MNILIKHVDIDYQDLTTFDDPEPDLVPVDVDIHYEMYSGQNQMPGKLTMGFKDYELMNHSELVQYLEREQQRHQQVFQPNTG